MIQRKGYGNIIIAVHVFTCLSCYWD